MSEVADKIDSEIIISASHRFSPNIRNPTINIASIEYESDKKHDHKEPLKLESMSSKQINLNKSLITQPENDPVQDTYNLLLDPDESSTNTIHNQDSQITETVEENIVSLSHYFSNLFMIFIALLIIATIILFVWSNSSDGALVTLQVKSLSPFNSNNFNSFLNKYNVTNTSISNVLSTTNVSDVSRILDINIEIFNFSLVSSVKDFWKAGAYGLALLIAVFSGIWPYIKLLLLLLCWIKPMKQKTRQKMLVFLDQVGKFSFIDLFVTLCMIIAFYVNITKEIKGFGINLKVVVEPDVGINTFVIGTVVSMLFSHVFLYFNSKYAMPEKCGSNKQNNVGFSGKSSFYGVLVLVIIVGTFCALIYSVFEAVPVQYKLNGLVGKFVSDPVREYSIWQIVTEVPTHTDKHFAAPFLSFAFFMTTIFFPILLTFTIITILFVPMQYKYVTYLNDIMQISLSWNALDVLVIASCTQAVEITKISQWILNQNYSKVCGPDGIIPKLFKGMECLEVEGDTLWAIWLLALCMLCLWILCIYTIYQIKKVQKYYNYSEQKYNEQLEVNGKSIFYLI